MGEMKDQIFKLGWKQTLEKQIGAINSQYWCKNRLANEHDMLQKIRQFFWRWRQLLKCWRSSMGFVSYIMTHCILLHHCTSQAWFQFLIWINLTNSRLVLLLRDPAAERVLDNLILSTPVTQGFFVHHNHHRYASPSWWSWWPGRRYPSTWRHTWPTSRGFQLRKALATTWWLGSGFDHLDHRDCVFFRSGIREVPRLIQATRKHSDS